MIPHIFVYTGATHADMMEAAQSFVCMLTGIRGYSFTATIHVKTVKANWDNGFATNKSVGFSAYPGSHYVEILTKTAI